MEMPVSKKWFYLRRIQYVYCYFLILEWLSHEVHDITYTVNLQLAFLIIIIFTLNIFLFPFGKKKPPKKPDNTVGLLPQIQQVKPGTDPLYVLSQDDVFSTNNSVACDFQVQSKPRWHEASPSFRLQGPSQEDTLGSLLSSMRYNVFLSMENINYITFAVQTILSENILQTSLKEMCKEQGYIGVTLVIKVQSMWGPKMEGFLTGIVAVYNPRGIVSSFAVLSSALLCGVDLHKDEFLMINCTCHIQYNH